MTIGYGANLSLMVSGNQGEQHYTQFMAFLRGIDGLVQPHAKSLTTTAPPASPADGDVYIVPSGATGAWSGKTNQIGRYSSVAAAWEFYVPKKGWRVYVEDEAADYQYGGASWALAGGGGGGIPDAPADGTLYGRKDNTWSAVPSTTSRAVTALSIVSGVVNIDLSLGRDFTLALTANVTSITFSNLPGSGYVAEFEMQITQDTTGSRTLALPSAFKALGGSDTVIASAANAVTVLSAKTFDNGATWRYAMQESA